MYLDIWTEQVLTQAQYTVEQRTDLFVKVAPEDRMMVALKAIEIADARQREANNY